MPIARRLLETPLTYDVVIGDFGRDATIEYLRMMAASEREMIESLLERERCEFFDEYRRIMFCVIGDVAFFKGPAISRSTIDPGYLTADILVGSEWTPMSPDFAGRVAVAVAQEALAALDRGHQYLRVVLPCNGLHALAKEVTRLLHAGAELQELFVAHHFVTCEMDRLASAAIKVHTVPEAVMRHLAARQPGQRTNLLILGTQGTNAIYKQLADSSMLSVVPLNGDDYELISEAIVASIGGDAAQVARLREQLQTRLIEPSAERFRDLVTVEACTDFKLGLGLSSLKLFAEAMVEDCYRTIASMGSRGQSEGSTR